MSRRAVFLDRDGVLNRAMIRDGKPYPPSRIEEVEIVENAWESLDRLKTAGFLLLVVTNQPDVRRGTTERRQVEAIHAYLSEQLPVDDFFACYHDDSDGCDCRKPLPGLLLQGAAKYGVDLKESFLIGDRWRDVEAGHAAGCVTVWINYGYREGPAAHQPTKIAVSLKDAVDWILNYEESRH